MIEMVINADDFGLSEPVTDAIDFCMKNRLINRTTIMVNMPFFENAKSLAYLGGYADKVGLHLNLTEGIPLTDDIKRTAFCTNGVFNGRFFKNPINRLVLTHRTKKAVRMEIEAQISKYVHSGFRLLHIDSHQHIHNNLSILKLLIPIVKEYGFKTMRISRNIPTLSFLRRIYKKIVNGRIVNADLAGGVDVFGSMSDYVVFFERESLEDKCELMVHPIYVGNEIKDSVSSWSITNWLKNYGERIRF